MIDGRLVTEISEEIIPNGNRSNINIGGTRIVMARGTTTATDNSYLWIVISMCKSWILSNIESILETSIDHYVVQQKLI